jgi:hypothetical protein
LLFPTVLQPDLLNNRDAKPRWRWVRCSLSRDLEAVRGFNILWVNDDSSHSLLPPFSVFPASFGSVLSEMERELLFGHDSKWQDRADFNGYPDLISP